jgi:hypothetical protein
MNLQRGWRHRSAPYSDAETMSLAHPLSPSRDSFRIVKATMSHTLSEFLNFYSLAKPTISGTATHMRELL